MPFPHNIPHVPLFDVLTENIEMREELTEVFLRVLDSGQYVDGPEVANFEIEFAKFCGTNDAIAVGSGTDALIFSLKALGRSSINEVIVPSLTFPATAMAVIEAGGTPVFVDVDDSLNLSPLDVERAITERTSGIIAVHWGGLMADMLSLRNLCERHDLFLIEDAAQAHTARFDGNAAGSLGDTGCFSFFPTKTLGGIGNGGIVTTSNPHIASEIRLLRNFGRVSRECFVSVGRNSRLDEIQAAVLRIKLRHSQELHSRREAVARRYDGAFKGLVRRPVQNRNQVHAHHLYMLRVPNPKHLIETLSSSGVQAAPHYRWPCHTQAAFTQFATRSLPVTNVAARELVTLPLPLDESAQCLVINTTLSALTANC